MFDNTESVTEITLRRILPWNMEEDSFLALVLHVVASLATYNAKDLLLSKTSESQQ